MRIVHDNILFLLNNSSTNTIYLLRIYLDEIIQAFRQEDIDKAIAKEEGDNYSYDLPVPEKIRVIAQALAYRRPAEEDVRPVLALINLSYLAECIGREAFRKDEECISFDRLTSLMFEDVDHQWLIVEAPGRNLDSNGGVGEGISGSHVFYYKWPFETKWYYQ